MTPCYHILRFSPAPEFIDPVNIALVVNDGTQHVFFDDNFRRLKCVAPGFNVESLKFLLRNLDSDLSRRQTNDYETFIRAQSAQLCLSGSRALETAPQESIIEGLINDYLLPLSRIQNEPSVRKRENIETQLGIFLLSGLDLPTERIHKRAQPDSFLRHAQSRNLLRSKNIKVKRVVDGKNGIVLVDGINLLSGSNQHIRQRTETIAMNYYSIGKVQKELESFEDRFIHRAAVVFGMNKRSDDSRRDYYVHQLEGESDYVIDPENPSDLTAFRKECNNAIGHGT